MGRNQAAGVSRGSGNQRNGPLGLQYGLMAKRTHPKMVLDLIAGLGRNMTQNIQVKGFLRNVN